MQYVETEVVDQVITLSLVDEEHRNVLSIGLLDEFNAALSQAEQDPGIRVVVITNRGRVFCAGADLKGASVGTDRNGAAQFVELLERLRRFPKPVVGRIAGSAVAGGMGLVAVLDISVAVEDALFGFTEVRVGVAPAIISVVCLPKLRLADARELLLRGHRFPAAEAARYGLINRAVPQEELDSTVSEIVADLVAGGPGALAAVKDLLLTVPGTPDNEAFAWAANLSARLFAGDEAKEGMTAFREKRPAVWR